jgi:hypothetical protein
MRYSVIACVVVAGGVVELKVNDVVGSSVA